MDNIQWYTSRLLEQEGKSSQLHLKSNMTKFLAQLSELELAFLRDLMTLETTFRESETGETSLNRDEENQRWP